MNYVAKVRFLYDTPDGRHGFAVHTVNVKEKDKI